MRQHAIHFDLPRDNCIDISVRKVVTSAEFESIRRIFTVAEMAFVDDSHPEARGWSNSDLRDLLET